MKICEFCGKEIDYNHAFCSDECEEETFQYHKKRKKYQTIFSTISVICFILIMVGAFIGLISQELKFGLLISSPGALILGITYILLPYYGIEEQIHKQGLRKGRKTMILLGLIVALIGVLCLLSGLLIHFSVV